MVQAINYDFFKPVYNGVNINIKKPEVRLNDSDCCTDCNSISTDNGIYNAVNIEIDKPVIRRNGQNKIYDYPNNNNIVTYDMLCSNQITVPAELIRPQVPAPNYTTIEAEKNSDTQDSNKTSGDVAFKAAPDNIIQRPEIIPSEDIKPTVNIQNVVDILSGDNYDEQAKELENIFKTTAENPENGIPYIVRDVFTSLINITKKDTSKLAPPTDEQIKARQKIIVDIAAMQQNPKLDKLPFEISENEIKTANELSPMEKAERNKEYALYTMAFLAKVYGDEVQKHTGNVVPMTDIPGMSEIVDELRKNPNPEIRIASLASINHLYKPEYRDEIKTIFEIASKDNDPRVAQIAQSALISI